MIDDVMRTVKNPLFSESVVLAIIFVEKKCSFLLFIAKT